MRSLAADPDRPEDRHAAYVQSASLDASKAELAMMLESAGDEKLAQVWAAIIDHWAPPVPKPGDQAATALFLARLAADGLWAHRAVAGSDLPPEIKAMITRSILELMGQ